MRDRVALLGVLIAVGGPAIAAPPVVGEATARRNCATLNRTYPHGVGRPGAHDKSSGAQVTNFTRNKAVYLKYKSLDRDHDGIACEKR